MTLPAPEEWPTDGVAIPDTSDLLRERADATPGRVALVDADRGMEWTYDEVDRHVSTRCEALGDRATRAVRRVGIYLDDSVTVAETYFAAGRLDAAAVPLNIRLDAGTLRQQAADADLDVLVTGRDHTETALEVAPPGTTVVTPDGTVVATDEQRSTQSDRPSSETDAEREDERLVLFTSGTTGDPKGVRLTQSNLVASAVGSAERLGVDPGDRWLTPLPMYHMGGLAPLVRSTLYGTTTVVQREFDTERTADAFDAHGITGVSLVPTLLGRLLDADWRPPESLRFVLLGGSPTPRELVERSAERGVPVYPTYGMTETASQIATATPDEAVSHPETVGRPLSTVDVTVIDDEGQPVSRGETGEIVVDGGVVTPGYLDPVETEAAVGERGLHTGDLGYRDEGGRLWVVGRLDDRVVTGGENVAPERVAAAIRRIDGVSNAAVVGLPDEEWGERVAALVVGAGDHTAASIREALDDSLADYERPKTVGFADELPRTSSGTVDREAVRDRLDCER